MPDDDDAPPDPSTWPEWVDDWTWDADEDDDDLYVWMLGPPPATEE